MMGGRAARHWRDGYLDIRERILRHGTLDTEDIWLPDSGDGWTGFRHRHGGELFDLGSHEVTRSGGNLRATHRLAERVRAEQERWEEARRQRRAEQQAQSDHHWRELADAKAYWTRKSETYATQPYRLVKIERTIIVGTSKLEGGFCYWLPQVVARVIQDEAA